MRHASARTIVELPRPIAERTLDALGSKLSVPSYRRASLRPAVVHIGAGRFHRAHQAAYFDQLAERDISRAWGITGLSLRSTAVPDALAAQDGLYTWLRRGPEGDEARVVGSVVRSIAASQEPGSAVRALADRRTRLVTLTVTADGYQADRMTGALDEAAIEAEAAGQQPTSAAGYLVRALRARRSQGLPGFTVLSCDNVPRNGRLTRSVVLAVAERQDPTLARWIDRHVSFPNSMVDRITPAAGDQDRAVLGRLGVRDRAAVVSEPFGQWVIEDDFRNGRPPLEQVGVQFVDDVAPYALVKTRLLNGAHTALGPLGVLVGRETLPELIAEPGFHRYAESLMREVSALLPVPVGVDLARYRATLLERFGNVAVGDQLARLCERGSTKLPSYLLPSIIDARRAGRPHPMLTLAVAGWLRFLRGTGAGGRPHEVRDARAGELQPQARALGSDPRPLLRSNRAIFGALAHDERFARELSGTLQLLDRHGVRGAIHALTHAGLVEAA